jgi:hypothetical protein
LRAVAETLCCIWLSENCRIFLKVAFQLLRSKRAYISEYVGDFVSLYSAHVARWRSGDVIGLSEQEQNIQDPLSSESKTVNKDKLFR